MHHPHARRSAASSIAFTSLLLTVAVLVPEFVLAQASPFMTGASALQTKGRTILAAAARMREAFPDAEVRAFALIRTMGLTPEVDHLLAPCVGKICWRCGDAHRTP